MGAPAKFLFDTDFGRGSGARSASSGVLDDAAVAEAEARGYRRGFDAGQAEHALVNERRTTDAFTRAAAALNTLAQGLRNVEARVEAEAVEVAFAVARKLASSLIAREPTAEIAALAAESFGHLVSAPHIVVRVNAELYDTICPRLTEMAAASGFDGRLVVLAQPDIAPGDCRIEWADGGVVRDSKAIDAAIGEAVGRYLSGRRGASPNGSLE